MTPELPRRTDRAPYHPPTAAAYLVALGGPNPRLLDEFVFSFASLRQFHPELPVFVYHEGLPPEVEAFVHELPGTIPLRIAARQPGGFARNDYHRKYGWIFPELEILAAKIDVLLLTPGHTLLLDTDTEVHGALHEVLASETPWMHADEGLLAAQDGRDFSCVLGSEVWERFGWRGDLTRLRMLNSGTVWAPAPFKSELYRAKQYLWWMDQVPGELRGDNRLDEQVALSVALQEASGDGHVRSMAHLVDHYWLEKYEGPGPRTPRSFDTAADGTVTVPEALRARFRGMPTPAPAP
ncbi:MAG: hypothetical protein AAF628_01265 [Planctomycetota bacterium]